MGAGQKIIARLLGHADTYATERYTHERLDVYHAAMDFVLLADPIASALTSDALETAPTRHHVP